MRAVRHQGPSRVGVFTASYLALFATYAAVRADPRVLAYLVVAGVVALVVRRAHRLARFSPQLCAALSFCGLLHMVGGLLPSPTPGAGVFYETWLVPELLKYDQLVHFSTSAVVTTAAWHVCGRWLDPRLCPPAARAVLSVLAALGLGALNEGFEFLSSLRFANYVGGLANTGWDLVFNAFGAATMGLYLACSVPQAQVEDPAEASMAAP